MCYEIKCDCLIIKSNICYFFVPYLTYRLYVIDLKLTSVSNVSLASSTTSFRASSSFSASSGSMWTGIRTRFFTTRSTKRRYKHTIYWFTFDEVAPVTLVSWLYWVAQTEPEIWFAPVPLVYNTVSLTVKNLLHSSIFLKYSFNILAPYFYAFYFLLYFGFQNTAHQNNCYF